MCVQEKMTAIADAIRSKTGGAEALTLDQMAAEIGALETGGSTEVFIAPAGAMYTAIYANDPDVAVDTYTSSANLFRNAKYLEEATFYRWTNVASNRNNNPVGGNPLLRKLHFPDFRASGLGVTYNNTYIVQPDCPALVDITLGKIGTPVISTLYGNAFTGCKNNEGLIITVYVDAATIADAQAVTGAPPWGAANATVIYRNSTTGEVITE